MWSDVVGVLIGVTGLVVAYLQYVRSAKYKESRINKLRTDLRAINLVMSETYRLATEREKYNIENVEALAKIRTAHSQACTLTRSILQELSEIDLPYDRNKLLKYKNNGLITSRWLWQQAASFLKEGDEDVPSDLPEDTKDLMSPK